MSDILIKFSELGHQRTGTHETRVREVKSSALIRALMLSGKLMDRNLEMKWADEAHTQGVVIARRGARAIQVGRFHVIRTPEEPK